MANHKSAEKRHRQSLKRRLRNRQTKTKVRTLVRRAREASVAGDGSVVEIMIQAQSAASKAAQKGILHKKAASRLMSRLAKKVAAEQKSATL